DPGRGVDARRRATLQVRSARRQGAHRCAGILQGDGEAHDAVKRLFLVLVAALAAGCSPALREPPSVADLASNRATVKLPEAASFLREGALRWAKRPDVDAVKEAEALYLRAAEADDKDVLGLIGATRSKAWLTDH